MGDPPILPRCAKTMTVWLWTIPRPNSGRACSLFPFLVLSLFYKEAGNARSDWLCPTHRKPYGECRIRSPLQLELALKLRDESFDELQAEGLWVLDVQVLR